MYRCERRHPVSKRTVQGQTSGPTIGTVVIAHNLDELAVFPVEHPQTLSILPFQRKASASPAKRERKHVSEPFSMPPPASTVAEFGRGELVNFSPRQCQPAERHPTDVKRKMTTVAPSTQPAYRKLTASLIHTLRLLRHEAATPDITPSRSVDPLIGQLLIVGDWRRARL